MFRVLRLLVYLAVAIVAVAQGAAAIGLVVEWQSTLLGLLIATIVGVLNMLIDNWWSTVTQPYRPQVVRHETRDTPAQITGAATRARFSGALFGVSFVFIAYIVLRSQGIDIPYEWVGIGCVVLFGMVYFFPVLFGRQAA
jgi:hypothetical protein